MSHLAPSASSLQSTRRFGHPGQGAICSEPERQSPHIASIHALDDDSILNIFYLYKPAVFEEDYIVHTRYGIAWDRERWWYKLAHVCQRWRNLILGSASYLRLCIACTYDVSAAYVLAHSPPLPLVIDYFEEMWDVVAEGEEGGITLALEQRDRVRCVRLRMYGPKLKKFIMAMDGEYPMMEYLIMEATVRDVEGKALMLPETLHVPHLRHLLLSDVALPIRPRLLLTTAVGLVTLSLTVNRPPSYFQPDTLLQLLSFMPQLEKLLVFFSFHVLIERQLVHIPTTANVTLPNLRYFRFQGSSAYMETVVRQITTPRLEGLRIRFFREPTFSLPSLSPFMNVTEKLSFDSVKFKFAWNEIYVGMYLRDSEEAEVYALSMTVCVAHLKWQIPSVAQILDSPGQIFFTVEHLTLELKPTIGRAEADCAEWRKLLRPFGNVKTLHVDDGLVKQISCCLRTDDGEHSLGLLPGLQELTYSGSGDNGDAFTSFIDARQNAGRPITLVRP